MHSNLTVLFFIEIKDHCRAALFVVYIFSSAHPLDDLPRKKSPQIYKPPTPEMLAYLDFSVSTTGILAGVKVC